MVKKQGNVMKFLPLLFSLAAITILSLFHISYLRDMDVKDQADLISREYILKMETVGRLTSEDENRLKEELERIGVSHINLSGTTRTEVGYGSPISLTIEGYVESDRFHLYSLFGFHKNKERVELKIKKTSTAKH